MTNEIFNAYEVSKAALFARYNDNYVYTQVEEGNDGDLILTIAFYQSRQSIGAGSVVFHNAYLQTANVTPKDITDNFAEFIVKVEEKKKSGFCDQIAKLRKEIADREAEIERLQA